MVEDGNLSAAGISAGTEFLTEPQKLIEIAGKWEAAYESIRRSVERMEQSLQETETVFCGETGACFRKEMKKRMENSKRKGAEIKKLSETLLQIAGIYQQTEGENKNVFGGN